MLNRSNWLAALVCSAIAGLLGTSTVSAQAVYGTDYLTFRGEGVILDNPTPAACQSFNIVLGSTYFFVYRFTANPSLIAETLDFHAGSGSHFRVVSTQSPGFSLNGTSTFNWSNFSRLGNFSSGTGSSTMTILAGNNSAVST